MERAKRHKTISPFFLSDNSDEVCSLHQYDEECIYQKHSLLSYLCIGHCASNAEPPHLQQHAVCLRASPHGHVFCFIFRLCISISHSACLTHSVVLSFISAYTSVGRTVVLSITAARYTSLSDRQEKSRLHCRIDQDKAGECLCPD